MRPRPKPTAHLLHGFLGVGKTTFAKQLERDCAAIRFTHDEWMGRLYGDDPPEAHFADHAARVSALMEEVWTRCVDVGASVVLDFGFWSRAERVRIRDVAARHGATVVLYRLACPDDVARRRIEQRNRRLDGSLCITPSTYKTLKARFEPLGPDEACVDGAPEGLPDQA